MWVGNEWKCLVMVWSLWSHLGILEIQRHLEQLITIPQCRKAVSHVTQVAKDCEKILTAHRGDGDTEKHQVQGSTERHMLKSAHSSQTRRQDEDSIDGILSSTRNPGQTTQIQASLMLGRPPMYVNPGACVWRCEWNQQCFNANHFLVPFSGAARAG